MWEAGGAGDWESVTALTHQLLINNADAPNDAVAYFVAHSMSEEVLRIAQFYQIISTLSNQPEKIVYLQS